MSDSANPQSTVGDNPSQDSQPSGDNSQGSPAADGASLTNPDGNGGNLPRWHYQLSGDLQGHDMLREFDHPDKLAQAYLEFAGKRDRLVEIPGEDATPEQRAAFNQKFGIPDSPDGYELAKPEGLPPELDALWSDEDIARQKERFYEMGVSKDKAERSFQEDLQTAAERFKAAQQSVTDQNQKQLKDRSQQRLTELRKEFGDETSVKQEQAQRVFKALGIGETLEQLGEADNPQMVKAALKIHDRIADDSFFEGEKGPQQPKRAGWYKNTDFSK